MKIVLVTGGFDPLHSGHIEYFKSAKKLGDELWVGLNSDDWLVKKKGKAFMPMNERFTIIKHLEMVNNVFSFDDDDGTANYAIQSALALTDEEDTIIFANGGDRTSKNIPEQKLYKDHRNVQFVFGVGGTKKINSSSWILKKYTICCRKTCSRK